MNKRLWNTVEIERLPTDLVTGMIDHSYDLVVQKLPKKLKESLTDT